MATENPRTTKILIIIAAIVIIIGLIIIIILTFVLVKRARLATNNNPCQSLPPPTNVQVITTNLTTINVTWTAVSTATRYRVYIGSISGFGQTNPLDMFNTTQTNYAIVGMVLNRTYYVRVSAINNCGAESPLSPEKMIRLGLPPKFLIVSRANPALALRVGPDFENIIADNRCSGTLTDNLCVWQYDRDNNTIQSAGEPLNCMKTFPSTIDIRVKYGNCNSFPYYNSLQARQWNFDPVSGSLCNPQNPEGSNCIKINEPLIAGQPTSRTPFDNSPSMQFDLISL